MWHAQLNSSAQTITESVNYILKEHEQVTQGEASAAAAHIPSATSTIAAGVRVNSSTAPCVVAVDVRASASVAGKVSVSPISSMAGAIGSSVLLYLLTHSQWMG